ncbi:MOS1T transposase, partial [Acromyrmex insinuator]
MERSLEQRYAIKFCVRLGKNATETFQMLQEAFKDDCISRSQSGKWHKTFKEGREEVADEPRSGRPTTARTDENVNRVCEVLRSDRRLSIQSQQFVPQGETVNSVFYLEVLKRLKRRVARVRADIKDAIKHHHDNAPSHTAFIVANYLARSNTPVVPQSPYSPDLAPCDFFSRLKRELKGKHWEYLNYFSNHPLAHKKGVIIGQLDRILMLSHPKFHEKNISELIHTLLNNGYPLKFKHKTDIKKSTSEISVVSRHRVNEMHDFDWDNIKILDTGQSLMKRRISEMVHIKNQISGINKQSDTEGLPDVYLPLLKKDLSRT